ncbi:cellulase family glycosylhydrolase [Mucilaginibacter pocheonensis]|uniref:Aryl-phospho-beta-D-glucosidase BglC (GH1 family) n=1 Tax=Mucilaginibacter pocheonensis TaxID=398050 RepID=A0ABU1TH69_9SPHI|nr:cellulase family glycosylhydrolase [Mucilaginibacter pocheonensis]MDR6944728.1 aryl-phospho-beta-D-glucosidase BglC (GH1 family) [Mucilaginibacter pocheonensis]
MRTLNYFFSFIIILAASGCQKQQIASPAAKSLVKTSTKSLTATSYPSYNTSPLAPDQTGVTSTATQLAAKFQLGWNIGNTLEATGGETNWGNPAVTQALIDQVKKSGFTAVRIPCDWDQYANATTAQIQQSWLDRVKQVVQYCVNDGLYVILNIHWDGGWLENNCTTGAQAAVNAKQKAFWEQIATQMRGFDEHVIFASANEPAVSDATGMGVLLSYHQTFVNAVRSTGGRNSYRVLLVQGPSTNIDYTNNFMNTLPTDPASNRLMVEVHYYAPFNFAGLSADASWGNMFYYWGSGYHSTTDASRNATWGEESDAPAEFPLMKSKFIDKGIPVMLGEYGAIRRLQTLSGDALTLHEAGRAYYLNYITHQALKYGLRPFYFDDGSQGNNAFRIINRQTNGVADQQGLAAVMQGAQNGTSSTIQVGQVYQIVNRNSFKALEFAGWGTANQTAADQWDYLTGANQQFKVEDAGSGYYRLTPMHATGKCLEMYGWYGANGGQADLWDYTGGNNQKWLIQITDNGYYKIINANSGKALEVSGYALNNGGGVEQWDYQGGRNQQWAFLKL